MGSVLDVVSLLLEVFLSLEDVVFSCDDTFEDSLSLEVVISLLEAGADEESSGLAGPHAERIITIETTKHRARNAKNL